ncbi:MAG: hypothetical protein R2706_13030 [Acidimicrobiales bacterium]
MAESEGRANLVGAEQTNEGDPLILGEEAEQALIRFQNGDGYAG